MRRKVRTTRTDEVVAAAVAVLTIGLLFVILAASRPASATHDPNFPVSAATYRIPYADGTQLRVTNDHHQHGGGNLPGDGNDRIDMVADMPAPGTVVAAASGTIRAIVDIHGNSNGLGDGQDINGNSGATLLNGTAHSDAAEHSCRDANEDANNNQTLDPGEDLNANGTLETRVPNSTVIGICQNYNNYVWIEHPNGEWSKYTHMSTGSVPNSLSVGDTVLVGQPLGIEADIGSASGPPGCMGPPSTVGCGRHLHHEIALPTNPNDTTPFSGPFVSDPSFAGGGYSAGGFIQGTNLVPTVCDIANNLYADGTSSPGNNTYTANPCTNTAPTAQAGGPYSVAEGSTRQLDGTASSDPENAVLTYSWSPGTNLDNTSSATPIYSGVDDTVDVVQLTVSDVGGDVTPATALTDSDNATVTVTNVAPEVTAVGDAIDEGAGATVSATFIDPGTLDTHTATIDWDDGTPPEAVTVAQLAAGVNHVYGDNGVFGVTVTVTDDDGDAGTETVAVDVGNLDPVIDLDVPGIISFPGGDYAVVQAGGDVPSSAEGADPGSDDLTFTWSVGAVSTYFNNGQDPDPFPSPLGTFPFAASDAIDAAFATPGAELLAVTLTDDDAGSDDAQAGVIVTGTATMTQGSGWWKHQYSANGKPHIDAATAAAYLEIVNAVSSVFSESISAATDADAHAILSPPGGDRRARASGALMAAWLQFASGAVPWDAGVPLSAGSSIGFLDLMSGAEATILNAGASDGELLAVEHDLGRVRHAG